MIATHNPKTFDSRLKQSGIRASIIADMPKHLLSSQSVVGLQYFAAPITAANITIERNAVAALAKDEVLPNEIPDVTDGRIKQVLLPTNSGNYVALTPVPSGKVMRQVHERIRVIGREEPRLYAHLRTVQLNPVGANNHGDPIGMSGGKILLIKHGILSTRGGYENQAPRTGVLVSAEITNMQVSNNYVQAGLPPITAIGGAVHVIERATGLKIPFAVGFGAITEDAWKQASRSSKAEAKGKASIVLHTDEITANAKIYLFLHCGKDDAAAVIQATQSLNRIAGGSVWNLTAQYLDAGDSLDAVCRWIMPMRLIASGDRDLLDEMIDLRRCRPVQSGIVQVGYALLEKPQERSMSRAENKLHAWAEPVFSACYLDAPLVENGFWSLKNDVDGLFFWHECS